MHNKQQKPMLFFPIGWVLKWYSFSHMLQWGTGVSPGEGTGATMSDDEEDQVDSDANLFDGGLDGSDSMGFGPLIPTENERSLMERVRHELKHELKQVRIKCWIGKVATSNTLFSTIFLTDFFVDLKFMWDSLNHVDPIHMI